MPIPCVHVSSFKKECINPSHRARDEEFRGLVEENTSPASVICLKGVPEALNRRFNKWSHFILTAALRGSARDCLAR